MQLCGNPSIPIVSQQRMRKIRVTLWESDPDQLLELLSEEFRVFERGALRYQSIVARRNS